MMQWRHSTKLGENVNEAMTLAARHRLYNTILQLMVGELRFVEYRYLVTFGRFSSIDTGSCGSFLC